MSPVAIVALVLGLILVGLLLYWLLIVTEGVYLGARIVALLYNWVAGRYDGIKAFDPSFEELFLLRPMLAFLAGREAPWVLDVATGTGRVPRLLLTSKAFHGHVVGLDYARKMLAKAAVQLGPFPKSRFTLVWENAVHLAFPDGAFDLVTCLEALEFMPDPGRVLAEIIRVAQPGAGVVITRRRGWEARLMPGKCWSAAELTELMNQLGVEQVSVVPWQVDYDLVLARKQPAGAGQAVRKHSREDDLMFSCPECSALLTNVSGVLHCNGCGRKVPVAQDGVVELAN